jgi:hypothetical protein
LADGTAAAGSSLLYARQDHVHPTDATRLGTANNLADLANAGAARTNLGLGGAAVLNVGAVMGTVAAGDDPRITGAQPAATLGGGVVTAAGAPAPRTLSARFADRVSVKDFGAAGNGVADDTAAINAACAAGRMVLMPAGTYNVSAALNVASCALVGEDRGLVTIVVTASAVAVQMSGTSPRFQGITLNSASGHAAGYGIEVMPATYGAAIDQVTLTGAFPDNGIVLNDCVSTHIKQVDVRAPTTGVAPGAALWITGGAADTFIDALNTYSWTAGVRISYGSGIYGQRIDCVSGVNGIVMDPAAGQSIFGAFLTAVLADTNSSHGWWFKGVGNITDVAIAEAWASNNGGSGVRFDNPNVNAVDISASRSIGSQLNGIDIEAGANISVTGSQITDNSLAGSGLYDGVVVSTAANQVRITGCLIGFGGTFAAPSPGLNTANRQRYGINASPTGTGDTRALTFIGNQLPGNVTAALNLPTGAGIIQSGNSDQNGLIAGTYATASNPSFNGNVEITGDGSAPHAFLRVSSGNFQVVSSDYSTVLLDLTPAADLVINNSVASVALNVQASQTTRWSLSGGDTLGLTAYNARGNALGTVLTVNNATQAVTFNQALAAPTAAAGTATTQVATTAFVAGAVQGTGVLISAGPSYSMGIADRFVMVRKPVGSATSIVLPTSPPNWTAYVIKDAAGSAAANVITITGSAPIDGSASFVINQAYESVTLMFNGVDWSII